MLRLLSFIYISALLVGCSTHRVHVLSKTDLKNYRQIASVLSDERAVTILKNTESELIVRLLNSSVENFPVKIYFNNRPFDELSGVANGAIIRIPVSTTGIFHINIMREVETYGMLRKVPDHGQKVFVQGADDFSISRGEILNLAEKYAPMALIPKDKGSIPRSLEYIFSANGQGAGDATIFYSYLERDRKLYLRYWFLYSSDSKQTLSLPAGEQLFYQKSFTLVYDLDKHSPDYIVYSSHLPSQSIGMRDRSMESFNKWYGRRLYLEWDEVPKYYGHPIIAVEAKPRTISPFYQSSVDPTVLVANKRQHLNQGNLNLLGYNLVDLEVGKISHQSWNHLLLVNNRFLSFFDGPISDHASFFNYASRDSLHHADAKEVSRASQDYLTQIRRTLVPLAPFDLSP